MSKYNVPVHPCSNLARRDTTCILSNESHKSSRKRSKKLTRQYLPQNLLNQLLSALLNNYQAVHSKPKMCETDSAKSKVTLRRLCPKLTVDENYNIVDVCADSGGCKMISGVLQHYELAEKFDSIGALPVITRPDDSSSHIKSRRVRDNIHVHL